LVSAFGVALALILASVIAYFAVRNELRGQVDDSLRAQAARIVGGDLNALGDGGMPAPSPKAGGPAQYSQVVASNGTIVADIGGLHLPMDGTAQAVASGRTSSAFEDIHVQDSHLRMLALGVSGGVVELARPLDAVDHVLTRLRLILLLICLGGVSLAAAFSRLAARRVLAPLSEVANTAQHISETDDLTLRIDLRTDDEVGHLAHRFNAMLDRLQASRTALDRSVLDQRQLVADASHELRTPVTSLRTNAEILLEHPDIAPEERHQLLSDVVEQSEELTTLVSGLIELARDSSPNAHREPLRLDEIVQEAVVRATRNSPTVPFDVKLEPIVINGTPDRIIQAVNNLLDNAAHHSPPGEVVQVSLSTDGLRVRDHGAGIEPRDLPNIFNRFYRGTNSRSRPGSGLGLAIVRQVIEQHDGSVAARNAPDGGAIFKVNLPMTTPPSDGDPNAEPADDWKLPDTNGPAS
jgi:two-component system sensor histidine kinase MprB